MNTSCAGGLAFWALRKRRRQHMAHVELAAKPFSDTSSISTDTYTLKGGAQVLFAGFLYSAIKYC